MAKEYKILITETLAKEIKIKANNIDEAYNQVKNNYYDCIYILDENCFVQVDFEEVEN